MEGKVFEQLLISVNEEIQIKLLQYCKIFASSNSTHKVKIISLFQKKASLGGHRRFVGFVGDGMNDCKALQKADFSVALGLTEQAFFGVF